MAGHDTQVASATGSMGEEADLLAARLQQVEVEAAEVGPGPGPGSRQQQVPSHRSNPNNPIGPRNQPEKKCVIL